MSAARGCQADADLLRPAFGCIPTGVMAFCGLMDGAPEGMATSPLTSVSLEPPLVSVCMARSSAICPELARLDRPGRSLLSDGHGAVTRGLADQGGDRFQDMDYSTSSGAVIVHGASLWLECDPFEVVPTRDNEIVTLQVLGIAISPALIPLFFHRSGSRNLVPTP